MCNILMISLLVNIIIYFILFGGIVLISLILESDFYQIFFLNMYLYFYINQEPKKQVNKIFLSLKM